MSSTHRFSEVSGVSTISAVSAGRSSEDGDDEDSSSDSGENVIGETAAVHRANILTRLHATASSTDDHDDFVSVRSQTPSMSASSRSDTVRGDSIDAPTIQAISLTPHDGRADVDLWRHPHPQLEHIHEDDGKRESEATTTGTYSLDGDSFTSNPFALESPPPSRQL